MSGNNKLYRRKMAPLTCKRSCTERKLWLGVSVSKAPFKLKILSKQRHPTSAPTESKISESLSCRSTRTGSVSPVMPELSWACLLLKPWAPMYMLIKTWWHQGSNSAAPSFIILNIDCNFSIRIIYFRIITVKIIYLLALAKEFSTSGKEKYQLKT